MALDRSPAFLPAIILVEGAEGYHGIDMGSRPVHPGAFKPFLDQKFVGTLDHPTADGKPLRTKVGIPDLVLSLLQVGEARRDDLARGGVVHLPRSHRQESAQSVQDTVRSSML